jgi:O-methyltransferase
MNMHNTFVAELVPRGAHSWRVNLANRALRLLGKSARLVVPQHDAMWSVESRLNLFHLATSVLEFGVPGDFVEIGCHDGESSVLLQRLLTSLDASRKLHVYDSFQGLPKPSPEDESAYEPGEMRTSRAALVARFEQAKMPLPVIHEGWFEQTLPGGLPDRIAFALIDGDIYASTRVALEHVYPRLAPRAIAKFGAYCDEAVHVPRTTSLKYRCPGVKRASDEFLADKPESVSVLYAGEYTTGYFRKR